MKNVNYRVILLFMLGVGLIYFLALNSKLDLGGDSANYILLAKAMIQGKGYIDIYPPLPQPHTIYPPVFPLLLGFGMLFFGENLFLLKFIPLLSMLGATYVFFRILKDHNQERNLGTIIIFALNPVIFFLAVTLMSEAAYLFFSFLSLLLIGKYTTEASPVNKYLWGTLFLMLLSFYTRSVGLVLLPVAFGFLLCKRNFKKALLISTLYLIGISPWIYRGILYGSGYLSFLLRENSGRDILGLVSVAGLLSRFTHNFMIYGAKVLADIFFYPYFYNVAKDHPAFVIKVVLSLLLFGLITYGYIIRIKRQIKPVDFYVPLVFIACFFWPVHGPRFIAPIFGFLVFYFICAVKTISKTRKKLVALIVLIILIPALLADLAYISKSRANPYEPEEISYLEVLAWLKVHSPADSIIMCRKPRVTFLIANRRAMYYPRISDPEKIIKMIQVKGISYVVLDTLGKEGTRFGMWTADRFLRPVIREYPDRFLCVYTSKGPGENYVYRVIK